MGISVALCALSEKRKSQLESDPELITEIIQARDEMVIPGFLDLQNSWDALDVMLSDRGTDPVLGDAILGRSGRKLRLKIDFGRPKMITADRVQLIATTLSDIPKDFVRKNYPNLQGKNVHGNFGKALEEDLEESKTVHEEEIKVLEGFLNKLIDLYKTTAENKQSLAFIPF